MGTSEQHGYARGLSFALAADLALAASDESLEYSVDQAVSVLVGEGFPEALTPGLRATLEAMAATNHGIITGAYLADIRWMLIRPDGRDPGPTDLGHDGSGPHRIGE